MDAAAVASKVHQRGNPEALLGSKDSHLLHPEGRKACRAGHAETSKQVMAATQATVGTGLAQDASSELGRSGQILAIFQR